MRHAHAVDEEAWLVDEARFLSKKGRKVARAIGQVLAAERVAINAIATSPLVRAVQTAELVAVELGFAEPIEVLPGLAPGGDLRALAETAAACPGLLLVGHEPGMSGLAALLTNRHGFRGLRKGEVLAIKDGNPRWSIQKGDERPIERE